MSKNDKERMPGKLVAAGGLMIASSILTLLLLLCLLVLPFLISWFFEIPVSSMSDMLSGEMNTMKGSLKPSPVFMVVFAFVVFLLLVLLIIFQASMMAHGLGILRGRLTKRPPYYLAIICFATVAIPPWGGVLLILRILTGVFMIMAFKDQNVKKFYERAKDPYWEQREPPMISEPIMAPEREVVSALVLE